jgi:uncharacterized protein YjbJ (UPF0337 family)
MRIVAWSERFQTAKENIMGLGHDGDKNVVKGTGKQAEGKVNEVAGAAKGDLGQELGGKVEKNVGKLQEKVGRGEQKAVR